MDSHEGGRRNSYRGRGSHSTVINRDRGWDNHSNRNSRGSHRGTKSDRTGIGNKSHGGKNRDKYYGNSDSLILGFTTY